MTGSHLFSQEWRPEDFEADDDVLDLLMEDRLDEARELQFEAELELDAMEAADRADDLQRDWEDGER